MGVAPRTRRATCADFSSVMSSPFDMPPSMPPAWLVFRKNPPLGPQKISSCTCEPGRDAASLPRPISTASERVSVPVPSKRPCTDGAANISSTASRTLLFDMNRFEWDDELLALFDVPRAMLPEVKPSAGYIGDVDFVGHGGTGKSARGGHYATIINSDEELQKEDKHQRDKGEDERPEVRV